MKSNLEILEQALARFADPATRPQYLELYATDAVIHGYAGLEPGLENIRRFYEAIWSAFPDCRVDIEDSFSHEDRVACRYVLRGTHLGAFQGIPPTGRRVEVPGITILRYVDGKVVERWSQADFAGLLQQLGA
jgi:steroid delta-isomerase-like uncharacterized protein